MKTKEKLIQLWQELMKCWDDNASHTFKQQHLNGLIECLEELEHEYEKFKESVKQYRH